ncbi:hypothetical protein A2U01_0026261, partial [Trifolium medium]|nr:hypothetical protein [Trifolium medium]
RVLDMWSKDVLDMYLALKNVEIGRLQMVVSCPVSGRLRHPSGLGRSGLGVLAVRFGSVLRQKFI